jgi:hypothetical protein
MLYWRRSISLLLILSAILLSGCHSSHAKSAPSQPFAAAAETRALPAAKHSPRDSALAVYHNPAYGISFRYPRNYLLHDASDSEDSEISEAQEQLTSDQPGSNLVALISIPSDAYPNTTFYSGTLQFIVNPALTPETCVASVVADSLDQKDSIGTIMISGVPFYWLQSGELAQHRGTSRRVYNAFIHDACYEFQLQVTTEPSTDPGLSQKPTDSAKILHQLDKIVTTVQVHPSAGNTSSKPFPVTTSPAQ